MICLLDPHDLSASLARHLAKTAANERTIVRTHGLLGSTIKEAFAELRLLATGARTAKPGAHAILSPSLNYTAAQWQAAWATFENEMGLVDQPYLEVRHLKVGRGGRVAEHAHRVYSRIDDRGKVIRFPHIAPRLEKAARICEHINAEALTGGRWNKAVAKQLEATGRPDLAAKMDRAGLLDKELPEATSRAERMASERLGDMSADEVKRAVYLAWQSTIDGPSFELRLREAGFRLCMGDAGRAMVLSSRGALYRLASAVASGAKALKAKGSVKAAEVHARVSGLDLPRVEDARRMIVPAPPMEGWQSITGVERSTLNVADPSRANGRLRNRGPQTAGEPTERSVQLAPASAQIDQKKHAPNGNPTGDAIPTHAERAEAEAYFKAMLTLSNQWMARAPNAKNDPMPPRKAGTGATDGNACRREPHSIALAGRRRADTFKADLAHVEQQHGHHIQWVDRKARDRVFIKLHDGSAIEAAPDRIRGAAETDAAIEIMVSAAKRREFKRIRFNSGSHAHQVRLARKLLASGIDLADQALEAQARNQVKADYSRAAKSWDEKFVAYWADRSNSNMLAVEVEIERLRHHREEFMALLPDDAGHLFKQVDQMARALENRRAEMAEALEKEADRNPGDRSRKLPHDGARIARPMS